MQPGSEENFPDLPRLPRRAIFKDMSTITAILEPEADGTLHLPVPEELRHGKVEVVAILRAVPEPTPASQAAARCRMLGSLKGRIWMAPDFDDTPEEFREYM